MSKPSPTGQHQQDGRFFTHHSQCQAMDCGLACLRMVRDWLGLAVKEDDLRRHWTAADGLPPEMMRAALADLQVELGDDGGLRVIEGAGVERVRTWAAESGALTTADTIALLLIASWNEDGSANPLHWILARDIRPMGPGFYKQGSKPQGTPVPVALVHDPGETAPYRWAWESIMQAPVSHGFLVTKRLPASTDRRSPP